MRPELPDILRSYARDLSIAGPQYATMSAVLREAADALETPRDANSGHDGVLRTSGVEVYRISRQNVG